MKEALSLYIHIPFCVKKCLYCDFVSFPNSEYTLKKQYIKALLREMEEYREDSEYYHVTTIFIGGGTPSVLPEGMIAELFQGIHDIWEVDSGAEITIECNPGTIDRGKLLEYQVCGINRISFGLQSADPEELERIGRIHNYEQFVASYMLAREMNFQNVNIDVMSALPGQTISSYGRTLAKVLELNPEHISAYSLIIEEETPLARNEELLSMLPSEQQDRQMYQYTKRVLKSMGYERYEISNYARSGFECRHNIGYWTGVSYLGLGLAAASYYKGVRFKNTSELERYLKKLGTVHEDNNGMREEVTKLTTKDKMEEFVFLGLRLTKGVSDREFVRRFRCNLESVYGAVIRKHVEEGLLKWDQDYLRLTDRGIDISNYVFVDFLLEDEFEPEKMNIHMNKDSKKGMIL